MMFTDGIQEKIKNKIDRLNSQEKKFRRNIGIGLIMIMCLIVVLSINLIYGNKSQLQQVETLISLMKQENILILAAATLIYIYLIRHQIIKIEKISELIEYYEYRLIITSCMNQYINSIHDTPENKRITIDRFNQFIMQDIIVNGSKYGPDGLSNLGK